MSDNDWWNGGPQDGHPGSRALQGKMDIHNNNEALSAHSENRPINPNNLLIMNPDGTALVPF